MAIFVIRRNVLTFVSNELAGDSVQSSIVTNKFRECRLGHLLIYTRFALLLFCIDFPEVYLKYFKSNPDTLRKCCLFDVSENCTEDAKIMSKSDQQTVTRKENST